MKPILTLQGSQLSEVDLGRRATGKLFELKDGHLHRITLTGEELTSLSVQWLAVAHGPMNPNRIDPAAVLGAAMSIYTTFHELADKGGVNLSDTYNGGDEFMRECVRVATVFETWASAFVDFDCLTDVWPYLLHDQFGPALYKAEGLQSLHLFTDQQCPAVARNLNLTLRHAQES